MFGTVGVADARNRMSNYLCDQDALNCIESHLPQKLYMMASQFCQNPTDDGYCAAGTLWSESAKQACLGFYNCRSGDDCDVYDYDALCNPGFSNPAIAALAALFGLTTLFGGIYLLSSANPSRQDENPNNNDPDNDHGYEQLGV